jgi:hypothetical protein
MGVLCLILCFVFAFEASYQSGGGVLVFLRIPIIIRGNVGELEGANMGFVVCSQISQTLKMNQESTVRTVQYILYCKPKKRATSVQVRTVLYLVHPTINLAPT